MSSTATTANKIMSNPALMSNLGIKPPAGFNATASTEGTTTSGGRGITTTAGAIGAFVPCDL